MQPGRRAPAPGSLALVQAFVNSHYDLVEDHGAELLVSPRALRGWLVEAQLLPRGAPVQESDLALALEIREGLRDCARANPPSGRAARAARARLNALARGLPLEARFEDHGPVFVAPILDARGAMAVLLGITARAMLVGDWARLKVCPGRDCGWAFYDYSRNRAGRWCSMSICGGREKARVHYRHRQQAAG